MKRSTGRNKNGFLTVLILGIFTFVLCMMFIFLIIDGGKKSKKYNVNLNTESYYAVCIGTYDTLSKASKEADNIIIRGGAGYIVENKGYNVLTSIYTNMADAQSVVEKLSNSQISSTVYKIKIPTINISGSFDYSDYLNGLLDIIDLLCDLYYKIDGESLMLFSATNEIDKLIKKLDMLLSLFGKNSENNMKDIRIKAEFKVVNNYLSSLTLCETADTLSLKIKQVQFKVLYGILNLLEEITD